MSKEVITIKIGGSIIRDKDALLRLCETLINIRKPIVLITGGGNIADEVRKLDSTYKISQDSAHWMAILAMDMNGYLLSDLFNEFEYAESVKECLKIIEKGKIPIFLTFKLMREKNPLPRSWEVTSDSIAAFVCKLFDSKKLILIKNVDGIYRNPNDKSTLIKKIPLERIEKYGGTCIDPYLPKLLKENEIECHVVSGFHPERVKKILNGKRTKETCIM